MEVYCESPELKHLRTLQLISCLSLMVFIKLMSGSRAHRHGVISRHFCYSAEKHVPPGNPLTFIRSQRNARVETVLGAPQLRESTNTFLGGMTSWVRTNRSGFQEVVLPTSFVLRVNIFLGNTGSQKKLVA